MTLSPSTWLCARLWSISWPPPSSPVTLTLRGGSVSNISIKLIKQTSFYSYASDTKSLFQFSVVNLIIISPLDFLSPEPVQLNNKRVSSDIFHVQNWCGWINHNCSSRLDGIVSNLLASDCKPPISICIPGSKCATNVYFAVWHNQSPVLPELGDHG